MNLKVVSIFIVAFLFGFKCPAQIKDDLKSLHNCYKLKDQQMSFDYRYTYYRDIYRKQAIDTLNGTYLLFQDNFLMKSGGYSIFKNKNYVIRINDFEKSITVYNPSAQISADLFASMDSVFSVNQVKVRQIDSKNSKLRTYRLSQPYGEMADSIEFAFDTQTFILHSYIVYFKFNPFAEQIEKPVLVARMNNHVLKPVAESTIKFFQNPPYFSVINGKLILKEKYKNYSLLNYLN